MNRKAAFAGVLLMVALLVAACGQTSASHSGSSANSSSQGTSNSNSSSGTSSSSSSSGSSGSSTGSSNSSSSGSTGTNSSSSGASGSSGSSSSGVPSLSGNDAQFVKDDTTTQGNWSSAYGADGYSLAASTQVLPSYASFPPSRTPRHLRGLQARVTSGPFPFREPVESPPAGTTIRLLA